ncbi:MAG: radical SAM protein [Candidatus Saganbacteria bacterium]|nr:radical SAM protein [Candidatus Saganbacteria bacterium]
MFPLFKELKLLKTPFFEKSLMARGVVDVEITHSCNLNCKSCHRLLDRSNFKHMPLEDLNIIFEMFKGHIKYLSINGGEPTLHPDIVEILKRSIDRLGGEKIIVATNGAKLNDIPDELLKKIKMIFFTWYPGRQYRIVYGCVYGCFLSPIMESRYDVTGLSIPLGEFKPDMKINCIEGCKYCYYIARHLNNRYNEIRLD